MSDLVTSSESALLALNQKAAPWRQVFVCLLEAEIGLDEVRALVAGRLIASPRFTRRVAGWPRAAWVDDAGFVLDGHVRETTLEGRSLQNWLGEKLGEPFDPDHPLWELWLVSDVVRGLPALVCFSHPALVAAHGQHLLEDLLGDDPGQLGWVPPASEAIPEPGWEELIGQWQQDPLGRLRGVVGGFGSLVENSLRPLTLPARPQVVAGAELDLSRLTAVRRSFGCTTHDVLLALVTGWLRASALDDGIEPSDLVAQVPLGVSSVVANDTEVVPQWLVLPVAEADPAARLQALATITRARRDSARLVPAREFTDRPGLASATLYSQAANTLAAGRRHQVWIANVPGPSQPRWLGGVRVTGWYSLLGATGDQQATVAISSYRGRLTFGVVTARPAAGLARCLTAELEALTAGGRG